MTLILTQSEVRQLLPMADCIDVMEQALMTLSRGDAINPLRRGIRLPEPTGILGVMPGYLRDPRAVGLKVVTVFQHNHGTEYDSHQGVVMLFELDHGTPMVIMDASEITAIRTAAVSAVATRLLANENAGDLAILGSGVQARHHLEAMAVVRPLTTVRVFSRNEKRRAKFAKWASTRFSFPVGAKDSAQAAVEGADIICTTTSSSEPVLLGDWIAPGAHINAVGSSVVTARELDARAVARSRLFVDRRESTVHESGDYLGALQEGAITEAHILSEIGDVLSGNHAGRESPEEITLFKSLGLAIEDLAAAHYVFTEATKRRIGVEVALGGKTAAESAETHEGERD
jgi:ornithine cyclodeaminase